jgi:hypothetical protein
MNFKRKHIALIAVIALIALAGCNQATETSSNKQADELANSTGQDVSNVDVGGSYWYEVKVTEKNQMGLVQSQSPFQMDSSLERENLIRRYQYLNDENNVHHVYLMDEGQVVSYFVAQGKVSSVNSKLTNDKQIVEIEGCTRYKDRSNGAYFGTDGNCYRAVESPQMDGSYGTNGAAIFFFTTSGEYVESSLDYVVSEEPKNIQDEVILKERVDADE